MKHLLPIFLLLAACGDSGVDPGAAHEQAAKAAGALMGALFEELQKSLAEGPPEQAIHVCGGAAQKVTERVRREQGITVRRTSLRVRNPMNAPDAYEKAWLEKAQTRKDIPPQGESEVVVAEDGHKDLRFMRPVYLAEMCAKCHGSPQEISPAVRVSLAKRYPKDEAVGFKAGDLRGVVSVRVPLN
ncbi:MAG: Tll0287-like domain-containing protein [Planctomycetota bacterium]|jgi:hypothetical protein